MPSSPARIDYIPLAQYPFTLSPRTTHHATTYCLRRRVLLLGAFASALFVLYAALSRFLGDYAADIDDLDDSFHELEDDLPSKEAAVAFDSSYLPFKPPSAPITVEAVLPGYQLPGSCADAYFARGDPCYEAQARRLDLVWTWVNGSDPLETKAKEDATAAYSSDDPYRPASSRTQARLYRDHDELRHSLRSVLLNFRPHIGHFRLLTSDFTIPPDGLVPPLPDSNGWRVGQIPQWLDLAMQNTTTGWHDGAIPLRLAHHAEIFSPYTGTNFNSLAIESQLGHLQGISEVFIYMNDDLYFYSPITATTFYTSAYGIVLHMQSNLLVSPDKPTSAVKGEWRSMGESNYLLSTRFGKRWRPYIMHEAKPASRALLAELEAVWPAAFAHSAAHAFRETAAGDGDLNTMLLHAHFLVERAREALLWTWAVARVGGVDDAWGEREARMAWEALGGVWGEESIDVRAAYRDTLAKERVERTLKASGHDGAGRTAYTFSSLDGFAYMGMGRAGRAHFPSLTSDVRQEDLPRCRIEYNTCFGAARSASDAFKSIAFENVECGDCAITALIAASGPLGISAFLPPPERVLGSLAGKLPADQYTSTPAHLPLDADWHDARFGLRDVMDGSAERSVRAWAVQLLQRYRYVMGETPAMFERLQSPRQATALFKQIEGRPDIALLCLNDDVGSGDAEVRKALNEWQERHWGMPAAWEKT